MGVISLPVAPVATAHALPRAIPMHPGYRGSLGRPDRFLMHRIVDPWHDQQTDQKTRHHEHQEHVVDPVGEVKCQYHDSYPSAPLLKRPRQYSLCHGLLVGSAFGFGTGVYCADPARNAPGDVRTGGIGVGMTITGAGSGSGGLGGSVTGTS